MSIDDQLARALDAAAPDIDGTGMWEELQPRIRRARRRHRIQVGLGAGAVAAVMAVAAVGAIAASTEIRGNGPATGPLLGVTTTVPATTVETTTTTTEPGPSGSDVEGAIDTVAGWLQAFAAGDADAAWNLLSASSQQAIGRTAFDTVFVEMEEGFGSWQGADPEMGGIPIDIGSPPAVVVTISGTRTVEGIVEAGTSVFAAILEDGAWRIEWYLSDPGVVTAPRPESSAFFSPTGPVEWTGTGDGVNLLLLDGEPVSGLEEVPEGSGQARLTWVPPEPLPAGAHTFSFVTGHHGGPVTIVAVPVVVAATAG